MIVLDYGPILPYKVNMILLNVSWTSIYSCSQGKLPDLRREYKTNLKSWYGTETVTKTHLPLSTKTQRTGWVTETAITKILNKYPMSTKPVKT